MDNKLIQLHELLHRFSALRNCEETDALFSEYSESMNAASDSALSAVLDDLRMLCDELISSRCMVSADGSDSAGRLTPQQQAEYAEADRVISLNLFNYHFQPIINAHNGEIYAYEALMRPDSDICTSPYHIIKYAEYSKRLNDIERATFMNVLKLIGILDKNYRFFNQKRIFINSIPKTVLSEDDRKSVNQLLTTYSDRVVVEMTEQAELNDPELDAIKKMYSELGVKIAIDDYGTGYSNIQNLLRYMPDYVKIDRSLLSGIQNDQKKRHFVREIIDFCHDNNILALAEGVETEEELHTVIKLGADLIQGYYTSRPARAVIEAIPDSIRQEIVRYHQEREDGRAKQVYTADSNERISLDRLVKEDYTSVLITESSGDVTLVGTPGAVTRIHIDVAKYYKGCVTLENANILSEKNRPAIDIGANSDVKLLLAGNNKLDKGGIRVPEDSRLLCCGIGDLSISVDGLCFYAIGNDEGSRHGELVFEQGILIENTSPSGICIGSGLGGVIRIRQGRFSFNMRGYVGVGIGALNADTDIELFACDMNMDLTLEHGVGIGSLYGSAKANIQHASVKIDLSGSELVGIGTINGSEDCLEICEASAALNVFGDNCSAIAALNGNTHFELSKAGLNITASGDKAMAIGGHNGTTNISLVNSATSIDLSSSSYQANFVPKENVIISGGRTKFTVNGTEYLYK